MTRTRAVAVVLLFAACHQPAKSDDVDAAVPQDQNVAASDLSSGAEDLFTTVVDGAVDATMATGGLPILPAEVVTAGCTKNVFFDDFDDLHTIDLNDTRAAGFNWYVFNPQESSTTPATHLTAKTIGTTTVVRFDPAGGGINGYTRTSSGGTVGTTFNTQNGKCLYAESRMAMGLASKTSGNWPAFWLQSSKHFVNLPMPWAGDPDTAYIHYIEIDIMELAPKYSLNVRSTLHDWYGEFDKSSPDCMNPNPYCNTQDGQGLGPNVAGTYDSTEASPVFHRYGALWIPSELKSGSSTTYTQGSMHWFVDGKPIGTVPTWTGRPSEKSYVPTEPWTYSIADEVDVSLIVNTGGGVFTYADYVSVWQAP